MLVGSAFYAIQISYKDLISKPLKIKKQRSLYAVFLQSLITAKYAQLWKLQISLFLPKRACGAVSSPKRPPRANSHKMGKKHQRKCLLPCFVVPFNKLMFESCAIQTMLVLLRGRSEYKKMIPKFPAQ